MRLLVSAITLVALAAILAGVATGAQTPHPRGGVASASTPVPAPLAADGTWVYQGPNPPVGESTSMAFDSGIGQTVLFGGLRGLEFLNETWLYNAAMNQWTNVTPAGSPHARVDAGMAYDPVAGRVVLFGGAWWVWDPTGGILYEILYNDLWIYDGQANTWTQRFPANPPSPRSGAGLVYDPVADRLLLYGGRVSSGPVNETWAYDYASNAWTNLTSSVAPPSGLVGPMVLDSAVDRAVFFGTEPSHPSVRATWTYDYGSNAWTNATAGSQPSAGVGMPMAFDPLRGASILFGDGYTNGNRTWAFHAGNATWTLLTPSVSPPPGTGVMAWDSTINGIVLQLVNFSLSGPRWGTWLYLDALTAPTPPTQLSATAGNGKVTLAWGRPAWDGGSPVTNYTVYRSTTAGSESVLVRLGNVTSYADAAVTNGQVYYYEVTATNAIGESARSAEVYATPSSAPPDTTPPAVAIQVPANGSTVDAGNVTVQGTASDDRGVAYVDLSVDGTTWTRATGTASWSGVLNLAAGTHTIYARATDTSGNAKIASITVTVVGPGGTAATTTDYLLYAGAGAFGVVVIALVVVYLVRRRRTGTPRGRPPSGP